MCFMAVESRLLDLTIGCVLYIYVYTGIQVPDLNPEQGPCDRESAD